MPTKQFVPKAAVRVLLALSAAVGWTFPESRAFLLAGFSLCCSSYLVELEHVPGSGDGSQCLTAGEQGLLCCFIAGEHCWSQGLCTGAGEAFLLLLEGRISWAHVQISSSKTSSYLILITSLNHIPELTILSLLATKYMFFLTPALLWDSALVTSNWWLSDLQLSNCSLLVNVSAALLLKMCQ